MFEFFFTEHPFDSKPFRPAGSDEYQIHKNLEELIDFIDSDIVGRNSEISTPFGKRRITYADYTASGRALHSIESFIVNEVLPFYANTHTTTSATGSASTMRRSEAREIVLESVGGESEQDVVIFTGSGSTAAINKMVRLLTSSLDWKQCLTNGQQPLVLIGPFEHHSNILPWRESGALVIEVAEGHDGGVDIDHLHRLLTSYEQVPLKLGSFSAASNITGIIFDTDAIATALHDHDALALFDYAAGGPYLDMRMGGAAGAHKDAMFLSPHKFVGGVSTPGVLIVKRVLIARLARGCAPTQPGGGTVVLVTADDHVYHEAPEEREEGGTPDVVGSMRCALAFRLKQAMGTEAILRREHAHWELLRAALGAYPGVHLLGRTDRPRLCVVSFNLSYDGRLLHPAFVARLLNDLFGVQARAGCACAGPYGFRLLGVCPALAATLRELVLQGDEAVKPAFVRINANYFLRAAQVRFLADAVRFVADHGWKLLSLYANPPGSVEWVHRGQTPCASSGALALLRSLNFQQLAAQAAVCRRRAYHDQTKSNEAMVGNLRPSEAMRADTGLGEEPVRDEYLWSEYMVVAHTAVKRAAAAAAADVDGVVQALLIAEDTQAMQRRTAGGHAAAQWFLLPSQAYAMLRAGSRQAVPSALAGGCVPTEDSPKTTCLPLLDRVAGAALSHGAFSSGAGADMVQQKGGTWSGVDCPEAAGPSAEPAGPRPAGARSVSVT